MSKFFQGSEKERISQNTDNKIIFTRCKYGVKSIPQSPAKATLLAVYVFAAIFAWIWLFPNGDTAIAAIDSGLFRLTYLPAALLGLCGLLYLFGTPKGAQAVRDALTQAGLVNHTGEAPMLISRRTDKASPNVTVYEFDTNGTSLSLWEDNRSKIEAALNLYAVKIEQGKDRSHVLLHAVPGDNAIPSKIEWNDANLSRDEFVLALGETLLGKVTVDLAEVPHLLIGGSTGSGKTVLLKSLLMQCAKKGAKVIIADLKGGLDYSGIWYGKCLILLTLQSIKSQLDYINGQMEARETLFKAAGCENYNQYVKEVDNKLPRLIFACDEAAELFLSGKRDKTLLADIEEILSRIARMGRAYGMSLILCSQRPDANIIPPQIRSNLTTRICGRADKILAQIVMDSTQAAEQVPQNGQGRFYINVGGGTVFQGYWVDDRALFDPKGGGDHEHPTD